MAGLCASVLREPGHTPPAGAASASVTASVFAAGMAESCMDMSMLPDGKASLYNLIHSVSGGVCNTDIGDSMCPCHCYCSIHNAACVSVRQTPYHKFAYIVLSQGAPADFVLQLYTVHGESADDWHLIQRSAELQAAVADLEPDRRPPVLLAPLPSADASEAEHWAQAMSTASAGTGQLSSRVLAAAADRLRYLRQTR